MSLALSPDTFEFGYPIPIRWSDLDEFHHVNNAVYLTYFEESRIRYLQESCQWDWKNHGLILAHAAVDYLRPLLLRHKAKCYVCCSKMGGKSFTLDYLIVHEAGDKVVPIAKGQSVMVGFDYATKQTTQIPEVFRERLLAYDAKALAAFAESST